MKTKPAKKYGWLAITAALIVVLTTSTAMADNERILFLHHSTGEGVYNGGDVAGWIADYNQAYGTGYAISERSYPNSPYPWNNYPYDYWNLWINGACDASQTGIECLNTMAQNYNVIIFKHCFPGAGIEADTGNASVSSGAKRLENYFLQYRALRDLMDSYPNTIFIVWTLAPLHRLATDAQAAARARQFVNWVNSDFLTEDGKAHPNIFIFDFWGIVAEDDPAPAQGAVNCLRYEYEGSHISSDSHPNAAANQVAGPIFAQTIVDAIETFNSGGSGGTVSSSSSSSSGGDTTADDATGGTATDGQASSGSGGCFVGSLSMKQ